jgi:hypothetical protein
MPKVLRTLVDRRHFYLGLPSGLSFSQEAGPTPWPRAQSFHEWRIGPVLRSQARPKPPSRGARSCEHNSVHIPSHPNIARHNVGLPSLSELSGRVTKHVFFGPRRPRSRAQRRSHGAARLCCCPNERQPFSTVRAKINMLTLPVVYLYIISVMWCAPPSKLHLNHANTVCPRWFDHSCNVVRSFVRATATSHSPSKKRRRSSR